MLAKYQNSWTVKKANFYKIISIQFSNILCIYDIAYVTILFNNNIQLIKTSTDFFLNVSTSPRWQGSPDKSINREMAR